GTQPPNDLLDQRDQAILELSSYIDIRTHLQDDGRIDVHTANGRLPLISDNTLTKLEADLGPYRGENRVEVYMSIGDQREVISDYITGGALGGVLDFRGEMLDKAQNDLGVTLNALTASVNWQHYQGWDLDGNAGQEFFAPLDSDAVGHVENQGTEDGSGVEVSFRPWFDSVPGFYNGQGENPPYDSDNVGTSATDQPVDLATKESLLSGAMDVIGRMQAKEYELLAVDSDVNGSVDGFKMTVRDENEYLTFDQELVQEVDGTFMVPQRGTAEGITIQISDTVRANMQPGDKFLIQPHKAILSDFETVIKGTDQIASRGQSPLSDFYDSAWDSDSNKQISYDEFMAFANTNDDDVLSEVEFDALVGAFRGNDIDDDSDDIISESEFGLDLASSPAPAAYGDNVNMANMASLFTKKLMFADGNGQPSETIMGGYSTMASNVGMYVRGSEVQLTAQENVHQQILTQRESISGVSLDEEAANLMRFQQAYEAAAQIIATSQSIFQTLLGAVRG
ncbi:MAG: flagellar basal body rod C-terminal domain-containing protein, partial [Pseudomonadota bacterium]|nr:flagellar basal body rod C-terminal domain-containing protein [Pseudomonadota bacterium]